MRLVGLATGPYHEARENGGRLYGSATAVGHDEEAAKECWYHNVDGDIKYLFEAGYSESSPAERREHPGYSKLETRRLKKLDPRKETIVSPFFNTLYLYSVRPLSSPFSSSRWLSVRSQHHCVASTFIILRHSLLSQKSFALNIRPLSTTFVARQPTAYLDYDCRILTNFAQQHLNNSNSSFAGQLTASFSVFWIIPSTFHNTQLQRTHSNHGCL